MEIFLKRPVLAVRDLRRRLRRTQRKKANIPAAPDGVFRLRGKFSLDGAVGRQIVQLAELESFFQIDYILCSVENNMGSSVTLQIGYVVESEDIPKVFVVGSGGVVIPSGETRVCVGGGAAANISNVVELNVFGDNVALDDLFSQGWAGILLEFSSGEGSVDVDWVLGLSLSDVSDVGNSDVCELVGVYTAGSMF